MYHSTSVQLNHFIDAVLWKEGLKLLEFQVSQKKKNKHYNTLSMYYYESVASDAGKLNHDSYFQERVASDLFYGLEEEFKIFTYLLPKPGLGLRSYKFFSYPLRALYYTMGIYLVKLTQDFLDEFKPKYPCIKSYYGGSLRFNGDTLVVNSNSTYYKKNYKMFRNSIRRDILKGTLNKVVLRLDIKDYFDEISIPVLLNHILEKVKPSTQSRLNYDVSTVEAITFFFKYLNSNRSGIPQTENDIIGGFIGYLYLVFADLLFHSEVVREHDLIENHSIIRYVDDIYIVLEFKQTVLHSERESFVDSLSSRIADILFYRLNLKLNMKSRLYWLSNNDDLEALLRNLKKVSGSYYIPDDDREDTPQEKVNNIFAELQKLKSSKMGAYFVLESSIEDDVLKEVFDSHVDQMLDKPSNIVQIETLFEDFNFDFVKVSPSEITAIMLHSSNIKAMYRGFLLNKKYLPTDDVDLILKYLAQVNFLDQELLEKLKQNKYMRDIVDLVTSQSIPTSLPGYYNVHESKLDFISQHFHVIEQIRLRVMSQKTEIYSVALNHLLNEIHALCLLKDNNRKSPKDYDVNDVVDFLIYLGVDTDICIAIRNLFDRRNINQVSHPGSSKSVTWGVSRDEYLRYYSYVGQCLEIIL